VLPISDDTIRLFIHVLAATIWVGGQLVLAGLVPTVRAMGDEAPRRVARAFNRIAWPAYAVLLVTGGWNLVAVDFSERPSDYQATFFVKMLFVAASGCGAAVHILGRGKAALAVGGALSSLGAVGALLLGISFRA
jgi:putative copper export protein